MTRLSALRDVPYRDLARLPAEQRGQCVLDVYAPAEAPPPGRTWPVMLWLHGGGLTAGDKADAQESRVAQGLAATGLVVGMANYRLHPGVGYPQYVHDAATAAAWLHQHGPDFGGSARQLFVGGHSAGAYLAGMVAFDPRLQQEHGLHERIAGVVMVSGQTFTHFTVRTERGVPDARVRPTIDDAAPCYLAHRDAPPTLLIVADKDMPQRLEENLYLAALLRSHGCRHVECHCIADREHGSVGNRMGADPDDDALQRVKAFVARLA